MDIAILGLSGDPPHLGHLAVAKALHRMGYARVMMMITPQNPLKAHEATEFTHRFALAKLLAEGQEDWLDVSDFEVRVALRDPNLRTFTTLTALKACRPDDAFTFVMGADAWADTAKGFHRWRNFAEIPDLAGLLILPREPWTVQALTCPAATVLRDRHADGEGIVPTGCWRVARDPIDHPASSTAIREVIRSGGDSPDLTPAQNAYVRLNKLYNDVMAR